MCRILIVGCIASGFFMAGCTVKDSSHPPTIRYGSDICDECRMIISERRFSASSVDSQGERARFDGIGCLIRYQAKHPSPTEKTWVHDYQSEEWIEAEKAFFVSTDKLATPMGFGIVAFSNRNEADRFALGLDGVLVEWKDLPTVVQKKAQYVSA